MQNRDHHESWRKTKPAPSPKTNTLVTGVILNTDGELIPDVDVRIYLNGERIAIAKSRHWLFIWT